MRQVSKTKENAGKRERRPVDRPRDKCKVKTAFDPQNQSWWLEPVAPVVLSAGSLESRAATGSVLKQYWRRRSLRYTAPWCASLEGCGACRATAARECAQPRCKSAGVRNAELSVKT